MTGKLSKPQTKQEDEELLNDISFRKLVEDAPEGILVADTHELTTYLNDSVCLLLGYSREELLGKPISTFFYQEDLEDHRKKMKVRHQGVAETYERRFRKKDGTTAWMSISAKPILDDQGVYMGSFGHFSDITEKKLEESYLNLSLKTQTELAVVTSIDEAYRLMGSRIWELLPESIVGITSVDQVKDVVSINHIYGLSGIFDDLVKRYNLDPRKIKYHLKDAPFNDLQLFQSGKLHPYDGGLYQLLMKKIPLAVCKVAEKQLEIKHICMMGLVGEGRHFGSVVILSKLDPSMYAGIIESLVNQTSLVIKRLRADIEREKSQSSLQVTYNAMEDGYWDMDVQSGQITVNDKWYTMLGYKPGEFPSLYENFLKLLHPDDREVTNLEIQKATAAGDKTFNVEFRLKTKSGDYKDILSHGKLIGISASGEPTRMVGTHIDITDRKNHEKSREVFYETQRKLLQISDLEELYSLAGNCLMRLLPDGYVVFTRFDDSNNVIKIVGFFGFGKTMDELLTNYGLKRSNFDVRLKDIEPEALELWQSNQLVKYDFGLYGLVTHKLPKRVCERIERYLGVKEIHVMGCSWNDLDFGGFVFLTKGGLGENRTLIETLVNDIAIALQRILAEQETLETQARFRSIFEKSPVGIVTAGDDMKLLSVNDEFCRITGYSRKELLGKKFSSITHPEHVEEDIAQVRLLMDGKLDRYNTIKRYIRKDGDTVWAKVLVNKINDPQGGFGYFLAMVTDISKEMIADEAIKDNQRFLKIVLDSIPNYVFVRDIEGRYRLSNKSFAEAMGMTEESILGKTDEELGDRHRIAQKAIEQDKKIHRTGKDWVNPDMVIDFPATGPKKVQLVKRALPVTENKSPAVLGVITDLTEQKNIEGALLESEERYRILVEKSPAGIMLIQKGRIYFANPAAQRIFGVEKPDELVGARILDFIHPDSRKALLSRISSLRKGQPNSMMRIKIRRKDGSDCETDSTSSQVTIHGENTTLVFTQDITERVLAEKEILKRNEDLALLKSMTDSVSRGDTLERSLAFLAEETKRIFSSFGAAVYLVTPDKKALELQNYQIKPENIHWIEKTIGMKIPKTRILLKQGSLYGKILAGKKFFIVEEKHQIQSMIAEFTDNQLLQQLIPAIQEKLGIQSVIAIPILSRDESVGLLELSSVQPLAVEDIRRLEFLSSELGGIIRRKQAENALRESEENFRQIVEQSSDIFVRQDFETLGVIYISPVVSKLLGYEPYEIIGLTQKEIRDFIHQDDLSSLDTLRESIIKKWREGGSSFFAEFRLRGRQGDFKWFLADYSLLVDETEKPKTIFCTLTDITERKLNELNLRFRLKLMQLTSKLEMNELQQTILDELQEITGSAFGFYSVLGEDEQSTEPCLWSENHLLEVLDSGSDENKFHFAREVVAECLRQRRPLILNTPDGQKIAQKKGLVGKGHQRLLVIPVLRDDRIVSVAGIGDKKSDYTLSDLTTVSKLVDMAWDIVENKRIEAELKESQTIFNAFIENSPIYVFFKDKNDRTIHLSRNYEQLLGKPLEQLLNKKNAEIFPAEEADRISTIDLRAMKEGQTVVTEEEYGGRYFTNIRFPIYKDDKPEYLAGFSIDVTDRVLFEKRLAESEELYRIISSVVSDYLFSTRLAENGQLELQWVAGGFEKITGYTLAEYQTAGGWRAMLYPEDYEQDDWDMENLRSNLKVVSELRTIKKDGSLVWVRVYAQPIWDEEAHRLIGINGAVQDITERKQAEEAIRKSAIEFEALYETAKDFSMHRDPYVILRTIADRAINLFNVSNAFVYLYDPDAQELELKFNKTSSSALGSRLKMGEGISGSVAESLSPLFVNDYMTWPGRVSRFEDSDIAAVLCVPMLYGGQLIGVLGIHENHPSELKFSQEDVHFLSLFASQAAAALYSADLFEQLRRNAVELEQRVDERTRELRSKNKELETFTYTVSHDLKAPLRGISGYSTLLMEDYTDRLDEEGKRYLQNLVGSAERMSHLIEDLLSYSRVERREIKKTTIDLRDLLSKIIEEYQTEIGLTGIRFNLEIECGTLFTDQEALTQALRNLVDNAVKFSRDCASPQIVIRCDKAPDSVLISVQDNGIGFDMQYYDKIFEIFQRLHLSEEYPGTGVGLAVVRKAAERLGGKIWAVSTPGSGSTFYLELPA